MKTRRKNKKGFSECYACWSEKHSTHKGMWGGGCGKKHANLPRKKKKVFKKFYFNNAHLLVTQNYMFDIPCSCTLAEDYKKYKPFMKIEPFLKKYDKEIKFLFREESYSSGYSYRVYEDLIDDCGIDENCELLLSWETDDDYTGGSSGIETVDWKKDKADSNGYSWSYQIMDDIACEIFGISLDDLEINSYKDFLEEMRKC